MDDGERDFKYSLEFDYSKVDQSLLNFADKIQKTVGKLESSLNKIYGNMEASTDQTLNKVEKGYTSTLGKIADTIDTLNDKIASIPAIPEVNSDIEINATDALQTIQETQGKVERLQGAFSNLNISQMSKNLQEQFIPPHIKPILEYPEFADDAKDIYKRGSIKVIIDDPDITPNLRRPKHDAAFKEELKNYLQGLSDTEWADFLKKNTIDKNLKELDIQRLVTARPERRADLLNEEYNTVDDRVKVIHNEYEQDRSTLEAFQKTNIALRDVPDTQVTDDNGWTVLRPAGATGKPLTHNATSTLDINMVKDLISSLGPKAGVEYSSKQMAKILSEAMAEAASQGFEGQIRVPNATNLEQVTVGRDTLITEGASKKDVDIFVTALKKAMDAHLPEIFQQGRELSSYGEKNLETAIRDLAEEIKATRLANNKPVVESALPPQTPPRSKTQTPDADAPDAEPPRQAGRVTEAAVTQASKLNAILSDPRYNLNGPQISESVEGPRFIRHYVTPEADTKIGRYLDRTLPMRMKQDIEAAGIDTPEKIKISEEDGRIAIDVTKVERDLVTFGDVVNSVTEKVINTVSTAQFPIAQDVYGNAVNMDLSKQETSHMIVTGSTGTGKGEVLKSAVLGLSQTTEKGGVKFSLIEPKGAAFNDIRDLQSIEGGMINSREAAAAQIRKYREEMDYRQKVQFAAAGPDVRDIGSFNEKTENPLPRLVLVIDELEELLQMTDGADKDQDKLVKQMVTDLKSITAKGRTAGVHIIGATQGVSGNRQIGPMMKNFGTRVALYTPSEGESMKMLGGSDISATNLGMKGDAMIKIGREKVHGQVGLVTPEDISHTAEYLAQDHEGSPYRPPEESASPPPVVESGFKGIREIQTLYRNLTTEVLNDVNQIQNAKLSTEGWEELNNLVIELQRQLETASLAIDLFEDQTARGEATDDFEREITRMQDLYSKVAGIREKLAKVPTLNLSAKVGLDDVDKATDAAKTAMQGYKGSINEVLESMGKLGNTFDKYDATLDKVAQTTEDLGDKTKNMREGINNSGLMAMVAAGSLGYLGSQVTNFTMNEINKTIAMQRQVAELNGRLRQGVGQNVIDTINKVNNNMFTAGQAAQIGTGYASIGATETGIAAAELGARKAALGKGTDVETVRAAFMQQAQSSGFEVSGDMRQLYGITDANYYKKFDEVAAKRGFNEGAAPGETGYMRAEDRTDVKLQALGELAQENFSEFDASTMRSYESMEKLMAQIEILKMSFIQDLLPAIQVIVDMLSGLVMAFGMIPGPIKTLIGVALLLGTALVGVAGGIGMLIVYLKSFGELIGSETLANITDLKGAFGSLFGTIDKDGKAVPGLVSQIRDSIGSYYDQAVAIGKSKGGFKGYIAAHYESIKAMALSVVGIDAEKAAAMGGLDAIKAFTAGLITSGKAALISAADQVKAAILSRPLLAGYYNQATALWQVARAHMGMAAAAAKNAFFSAGGGITGIKAAGTALMDYVGNLNTITMLQGRIAKAGGLKNFVAGMVPANLTALKTSIVLRYQSITALVAETAAKRRNAAADSPGLMGSIKQILSKIISLRWGNVAALAAELALKIKSLAVDKAAAAMDLYRNLRSGPGIIANLTGSLGGLGEASGKAGGILSRLGGIFARVGGSILPLLSLVPGLGGVVGKLGTVIGGLGGKIGGIGGMVGRVLPSLAGLAGSFGGASVAGGGLIASIGGILTGVLAAIPVWGWLVLAIVGVGAAIFGLMGGFDGLGKAIGGFVSWVQGVFQGFMDWLGGIWNIIQTIFGGIWSVITGFFGGLGEGFMEGIKAAFEPLVEIGGAIMEIFGAIGEVIMEILGMFGGTDDNGLKEFFSGAAGAAKMLGKAIGFILTLPLQIILIPLKLIAAVLKLIAGGFKAFAEGIKPVTDHINLLGLAIGAIMLPFNLLFGLLQLLGSVLGGVFNALLAPIQAIGSAIGVILAPIQAVVDALMSVFGMIAEVGKVVSNPIGYAAEKVGGSLFGGGEDKESSEEGKKEGGEQKKEEKKSTDKKDSKDKKPAETGDEETDERKVGVKVEGSGSDGAADSQKSRSEVDAFELGNLSYTQEDKGAGFYAQSTEEDTGTTSEEFDFSAGAEYTVPPTEEAGEDLGVSDVPVTPDGEVPQEEEGTGNKIVDVLLQIRDILGGLSPIGVASASPTSDAIQKIQNPFSGITSAFGGLLSSIKSKVRDTPAGRVVGNARTKLSNIFGSKHTQAAGSAKSKGEAGAAALKGAGGTAYKASTKADAAVGAPHQQKIDTTDVNTSDPISAMTNSVGGLIDTVTGTFEGMGLGSIGSMIGGAITMASPLGTASSVLAGQDEGVLGAIGSMTSGISDALGGVSGAIGGALGMASDGASSAPATDMSGLGADTSGEERVDSAAQSALSNVLGMGGGDVSAQAQTGNISVAINGANFPISISSNELAHAITNKQINMDVVAERIAKRAAELVAEQISREVVSWGG